MVEEDDDRRKVASDMVWPRPLNRGRSRAGWEGKRSVCI
jgi:hypothetical protein